MMSIVSTATQPDYVLPCPSSRRLPPFLREFLIVKLESLEHGNLPDEQNCGKSLPIFENGDTENFSKIRPLTSVCFKFFEKIVVLKLDFFFKEHFSVDKHQYACKNIHSNKTITRVFQRPLLLLKRFITKTVILLSCLKRQENGSKKQQGLSYCL